MRITVIITSLNDPRIANALESLDKQTRKADEILIADGGTNWDIKSVCDKYHARLEHLEGNIVESRQKALKMTNSDIMVFMDTDEVAPEFWLETLVRPIEAGECDFDGGPTKHYEPKSGAERYIDEVEDFIYENQVPVDIRYLPLGNSAWRRDVLMAIGGFDTSISTSEDYDANLRALSKGYRGIFLKDAWLYHDHSDLNSYRKLFKKRYLYLRNAAKVYLKNGALQSRLKTKTKGRIRHPFHIIEIAMKPIALLDALIRP